MMMEHITSQTNSMFVKILIVTDYFYLLRIDLMQCNDSEQS